MFRSIGHLIQQIHEYKLEAFEDQIVSLAKPSVLMTRTKVNEDDIPIGASKLGGNPDLPKDFKWPHWKDKPLTFIAQFKLSEVAKAYTNQDDDPYTLPDKGMLYFFYDADEPSWSEYENRDCFRIIYFEDIVTQNLSRIPHPVHQGTWVLITQHPAHRLNFTPSITIPNNDEDANTLYSSLKQVKNENYDPLGGYWKMLDDNSPQPLHFLHGYARSIQDKVESERWQFLFQIDSDESLNVMWGDAGTFYVCIPKTSLKQRKFEDCWAVLQSY